MDWYQLQYFQTLAKVKNFTKAADELALTQSALSRSIGKLEEELGVSLFERKSRGVVLNRYGDAFLQHVNRAMEEINIGKQELKDMADPFHGIISLAFIHTLGSSFVPNLIASFHELYPSVQFQVYQDTTRKIMNQLESGEIDLAFCSPNERLENVDLITVVDEELFLIVPKSHRLADKQVIELKEVADEPFVIYKHESGLRDVIENICKEAGFQPKVSFEGVGDETIAGFVAAKFGVALIPYIPGLDMNKISMLRVEAPPCRRSIQMVWRSSGYMSPVVQRFKKFIGEFSG